MTSPYYTIGQVVRHCRQNCRGVIIDVDPSFQPQGVPTQTNASAATQQPWYRILVDDSDQVIYIKETLLEPDDSGYPVSHPQLFDFLREVNGRYVSTLAVN